MSMQHATFRHSSWHVPCDLDKSNRTKQRRAGAKKDMHIMHPQIGVILFNMLCGPSLFRAAIVAAGESRRRGFQDTDPRTVTRCVLDDIRTVSKT